MDLETKGYSRKTHTDIELFDFQHHYEKTISNVVINVEQYEYEGGESVYEVHVKQKMKDDVELKIKLYPLKSIDNIDSIEAKIIKMLTV